MKKFFFLLFLFPFILTAQDPCGEVQFGIDQIDPSVYPPNFILNIINEALTDSPCVNDSMPTYGTNSITLDDPDLIPCSGDILSGLWVEAPNHEPLCIYTYPDGSATLIGTEFLGDLLVEESFVIVIIGVPIGSPYSNFVSVGWIPVNPTYQDTLMVPTCNPDSAGVVVVESYETMCGCDSTITTIYTYQDLTTVISGPSAICVGDSTVLTAISNVSSNLQYSWSTGDSTQAISVTEPGLYQVTITNGPCHTEASHILEFYPVSTIQIEAPGSACVGETVHLSQNLAEGYHVWTLPTGSEKVGSAVSFTAAEYLTGEYYLEVVDQNGCVIKDSTYIKIGLLPELPPFPDIEVCDGDTLSIQLIEEDSTYYEWINGDGYAYSLNHPWFIDKDWKGKNGYAL
ncbi:MAG: hypothetical protein IPJ40_05360 [Saprospirales bacterium]|nr:hypothetical protein [Saprospirales bacterium]